MFYGITSGIISSKKYEFNHVIKDIQTLNKMAINSELHTTAVSANAYLQIQDKYRIMDCGASMGDNYGPIVVAKNKIQINSETKIGIPGKLTSAFLLLKLYLKDANFIELNFDEIVPAIENDEIDAGLIIHEGQITYKESGYEVILNLPRLWSDECDYPIPLGLNIITRSLSIDEQNEISQLIKSSIKYALANVEEALDYSMKFGRGVSRDIAKEFVLMYVNSDTVNINLRGIHGLNYFYLKAKKLGLIDELPRLDIIETF